MRVIDFFCGAGGSSCGAEMAGFRPLAAVNHWEIAALTYEINHGIRPLRDSIQTVSPSDLPRADWLLFSPECTNHTDARGSRPRDEISRSTALEVGRFVAAMQPAGFVVENVHQIRKWPKFAPWIASLKIGYRLNHDQEGRPGQVLDSSEWGVPQARHRWILVGRKGQGTPSIQSPRLAPIPVGECIDWRLPTRSISHRKKPLVDKTLARIEAGRAVYGDNAFLVQYNGTATVQSLDEPCRTLPTHDRFALVHGDRFRFLQPSEMLRIFGFPPTYRLVGNRANRVMLLGNAVPPPLMRGVLEQVA